MASYKIVQVSQQPPREWVNKTYNTTTYYIKVRLEGHDRPVEIGKRSPNALNVGDVVTGTIEDKPEFDADGFKADKPKSPRDDAAIKAQFAIKAAIQFSMSQHGQPTVEDIEGYAHLFYAMVDTVEQGNVNKLSNSTPDIF